MGALSLVGGPRERGAGRVVLGHPTGGVAEDGARGVSASTRGAGGPRLPAAAGGATQQELGSRVRSLSGERACWRALLVGRAERRGAWLGFPFPSLFYFPTTLKLFEFKFEFEFNPSTETNKTMHQHECTNKLNLR